MTNPRIAAIIGKRPAGTSGPEIFEEVATGSAFRCLPMRSTGEEFALVTYQVLRHLRQPRFGEKQAVFLLCVGKNDADILEIVQLLTNQRRHARVIVYADSELDSGAGAIRCVHHTGGATAADYLVRDRTPENQVREQLMKHFAVKPVSPYPKLEWNGRPLTGRHVFIATPYHPFAINDCYDGIVPALDGADLTYMISRDEVTSTSVLHKVQSHIDSSQLVIVNLTQYHGFGPSMNVYFELGYALGRKIPVALVARAGTAQVASNIAGAQIIEYYSRADLALRLYFGLK
jgi:hypothetical protein